MFSHQLIHAPGVSYVMGTLAYLLLGLKNLYKNTSLAKRRAHPGPGGKVPGIRSPCAVRLKSRVGSPKGDVGRVVSSG